MFTIFTRILTITLKKYSGLKLEHGENKAKYNDSL